jgi:hypothetical protein
MASIGTFKKVGNDFQGEIITLSLQARVVRIVAESNRASENAPSHRVYVSRKSVPHGRSAPRRAATISRSNSMTPPSTRPSTRTCSATRVAKATRSSGRGRGRPASKTRAAKPRPNRSGGASCRPTLRRHVAGAMMADCLKRLISNRTLVSKSTLATRSRTPSGSIRQTSDGWHAVLRIQGAQVAEEAPQSGST